MSVGKGFQRNFCHSASSVAGFSFIEFLVTLILIAVSVSLALPSLQQFSANKKVQAASSSIASGLNMARFNAITTGKETTICPSADGESCSDDSWGDGWIVFTDLDGDSNADGAELIRIVTIEGNILANGHEESIKFEADGSSSRDSDTEITSCYQQTSVSVKCVKIIIDPLGSIVTEEAAYSETESGTAGRDGPDGATA